MNIVRHLSRAISPQVLGDSPTAGEKSLLKDFYAIFLARLSEQSAYDTLTNYDKLPAKKISWYKFVHNIDWYEGYAEELLNGFAQVHNLDKTDAYDLLRVVTPLTFFEIQAQADNRSIPDYLQSLLHSDDKHAFASHIPSWALDFFPSSLRANIDRLQTQIVPHEVEVQETIDTDVDNRVQNSSPPAIVDEIVYQGRPHRDEELPNPVHADASPYGYATYPTDESVNEMQSENGSFMKNILPLLGLLIFASLGWSMLRGCSSDLANQPSAAETNEVITINSRNKSEDIAILRTADGQKIKQPIKNKSSSESTEITRDKTQVNTNQLNDKKNHINIKSDTSNQRSKSKKSRLFVEVDNDGNLLKADIQVGNNILGYQLNKAISNVYNEVALRNSKMTVDENLKNDMLTMDKVNDLLTLVKETPQGSVIINGKSVSVNALRKKDRMNLIRQAQTILPSLRIINGRTGKPLELKEAKESDKKVTISDSIEQPPEVKPSSDIDKAIELDKEKISNIQSVVTEIKDKNASAPTQLSKPKPVIKDGKLDIKATVSNSNKASKQAIDSLNVYTNLQTVIDALNMQIINFKVNDKELPTENKVILDKAAAILKNRDLHIRIMGHTDSDGNPDYNQRLSQDRSYMVKKYLMSQGVESWKIKADGYGEDKPVASNSTDEGKFRNRRIEFSLITSDQ